MHTVYGMKYVNKLRSLVDLMRLEVCLFHFTIFFIIPLVSASVMMTAQWNTEWNFAFFIRDRCKSVVAN